MDIDSQIDSDMLKSDFIRGEVLFLVEHSSKLSPQEIKSKLYTDPTVAGNQQVMQAIEGANIGRIITFDRIQKPVRFKFLTDLLIRLLHNLDAELHVGSCEKPASYFSVVFTTVNNDKGRVLEDELLSIVRTLDKQIVSHQFNRRRRSIEPQRRIIPNVARKQDISDSPVPPSEIPYNPDFVVMAASPNWTMSGAQSQLVTGGPGSEPEPTTAATPVISRQTVFSDIAVPSQIEGTVAPLDVYILDTAPTRMGKEIKTDLVGVIDLLKAARNKWVDTPPAPDKHKLMSTLLELQGSGFKHLEIIMDDCLRDDGTSLMAYLNAHRTGAAIKGHNYPMTDHGLFVASIIHRDIPDANLHLVQVLNDFGVGTIETLLRGMQKVIQNYKGNPTIVNCSLMMDIPLIGHPINTDDETVEQTLDELRHEVTPLERMGWLVEWACDLLTDLGIIVVASAGNDAQPSDRPQARYPAGFDSVIGIAAADRDGNPASYSNRADRPPYEGFITFGGEAGRVQAGDRRVSGVYVGNFPDGTPNGAPSQDGWAYWSGTSFAAPAISGLLGSFRRRGIDKNSAMQQVFTSAARFTTEQEHIVKQTL